MSTSDRGGPKDGDKKSEGSQHAAALGARGAAKGGRARAAVLTDRERSESARRAARARWKKNTVAATGTEVDNPVGADPGPESKDAQAPTSPGVGPGGGGGGGEGLGLYSMFPGTLEIGPNKLNCHVLNDGRRVFAQQEVVSVLTGGTRHGNLARYLQRNPLTQGLITERPIIHFRIPKGNAAYGYEAEFLIELCEAFLKAKEQKLLKDSQEPIVQRALILIRACAKTGINALIDEVTGYQEYRQKQDLQMKFKAYIAEDMQEWAKMFPDEFWYQLARLENINYNPKGRPLRWGKYVMAFVYDAIDKDVGDKLREINPNPHHRKNHHQWLQEFGKDRLQKHLYRVIGIMEACTNMDDFRKKFAHIFKHMPLQLSFLQ